MITCIARDYVQLEKKSEYLTLITELAEKTRTETGNISYVVFEDRDNDGEFAIIEEWENQESLEMHFKAPHFTRIVPQIQKLLKKTSALNTYETVQFQGEPR